MRTGLLLILLYAWADAAKTYDWVSIRDASMGFTGWALVGCIMVAAWQDTKELLK